VAAFDLLSLPRGGRRDIIEADDLLSAFLALEPVLLSTHGVHCD